MDQTQATALIFECLEALNRERSPAERIAVAEDTELLSDHSTLDSLGFVSFVTDLEDRILASTGKDLMLATAALSGTDNPFRSVRTLATYVVANVGGAAGSA